MIRIQAVYRFTLNRQRSDTIDYLQAERHSGQDVLTVRTASYGAKVEALDGATFLVFPDELSTEGVTMTPEAFAAFRMGGDD